MSVSFLKKVQFRDEEEPESRKKAKGSFDNDTLTHRRDEQMLLLQACCENIVLSDDFLPSEWITELSSSSIDSRLARIGRYRRSLPPALFNLLPIVRGYVVRPCIAHSPSLFGEGAGSVLGRWLAPGTVDKSYSINGQSNLFLIVYVCRDLRTTTEKCKIHPTHPPNSKLMRLQSTEQIETLRHALDEFWAIVAKKD